MDLPHLIETLSAPAAYPYPVGAVEVRQTHISAVFLAGPYVYKVKKPVNLGFLDFSILEKRHSDRPAGCRGLPPPARRRRPRIQAGCSMWRLRQVLQRRFRAGIPRIRESLGPLAHLKGWRGGRVGPKPLTAVAADTCRGQSAKCGALPTAGAAS